MPDELHRSRPVKAVKIIVRMINTLIVAAAVLLAVLLVGMRLVGFQLFAVLSGSMEPEYPVGALIYVKETDPAELKAGDVITYHLAGDTISTSASWRSFRMKMIRSRSPSAPRVMPMRSRTQVWCTAVSWSAHRQL